MNRQESKAFLKKRNSLLLLFPVGIVTAFRHEHDNWGNETEGCNNNNNSAEDLSAYHRQSVPICIIGRTFTPDRALVTVFNHVDHNADLVDQNNSVALG
ncbi:hypothetical protein FIV00_14120 [Labrenzia sp. THAF82]|nr:hypothetical protein FIV00_14120 [Labrenzia sp. THAF82]